VGSVQFLQEQMKGREVPGNDFAIHTSCKVWNNVNPRRMKPSQRPLNFQLTSLAPKHYILSHSLDPHTYCEVTLSMHLCMLSHQTTIPSTEELPFTVVDQKCPPTSSYHSKKVCLMEIHLTE